ncbi:PREDICTED: uncharacterized protein LOC107073547 isoform X2 [Polistes dominula]|uniref:Uncharacterized protein LOC107073547 isoform X2 n=1 Tax=Polistes dominula TaxID=743375 RepID=A0ABM1JB84_POLDO|nr:PREDICTED: uncharacterized protein LOC107073547 isoform X2 [Polistes dominula]
MAYLITTFLALSVIAFDFLYIFQLSISLNNATEIVECSFYIAGSLFTIYINFYLGQELTNHSNLVYEELCQVPFYTLSNKTQKFLLFIIAKSCKASTISIGGMFVSTHATFAALIRKAFSFAMVYYSTL